MSIARNPIRYSSLQFYEGNPKYCIVIFANGQADDFRITSKKFGHPHIDDLLKQGKITAADATDLKIQIR